MAIYKVTFCGFAYVEADSPAEAMSLYDSEEIYGEEYVEDIREVDEGEVDFS